METIEENQTKCEMMSISPPPDNVRICLVGDVVDDAETVAAAQIFGVPIITSETGLEIIDDYDWRTHFILKEFEGPIYEAIHKSKQSIMGPPALKHAADMKEGLKQNTRPIYNFSMRGVVTCFTGIRKKDELTQLVNLIHSMGGCIRKDMNSKITHLICKQSGGEKYQYAKTFRLTVVRPAWVYAAWEKRNEAGFCATLEEFSKEHKLKAFEGQKICFFGFPDDEHQHMIEVLQNNGGIPAELDDPECSHVVMPNSGGYFPDTISNTSPSPPPTTDTQLIKPHMPLDEESENIENLNRNIDKESFKATGRVDGDGSAGNDAKDLDNENISNDDGDDEDDNDNDNCINNFDAQLFTEIECQTDNLHDQNDIFPPSYSDIDVAIGGLMESELNKNASTPKVNKLLKKKEIFNASITTKTENVEKEYGKSENISPISGTTPSVQTCCKTMHDNQNNELAMDTDENNPHELADEDQFMLDEQNELKRKRESSDTISLMSTESFALPTSTKKPKLIRAGSITRSIKRSMSFVAVRTPIAKMLRPRRSSVVIEAAPPLASFDADSSFCSFTSIDNDSMMNESVMSNKPIKEKLRSFRDRFVRGSSKKEKFTIQTPDKTKDQTTDDGFKTPKAPSKFSLFKNITEKPFMESMDDKCSSNSVATVSSVTSSSQQKILNNNSQGIPHTNNPNPPPSHFPSITNSSLSSFASNVSSAPTTSVGTSVGFHCINQNKNQSCSSSSASQMATNAVQYVELMATATTTATTMSLPVASTTSYMSPQDIEVNNVGRFHPLTVVDEHFTLAKPEPKNSRTHILKSDWFWYTIQNGYADEMDYLFGDYLDSIANTPNTDRRESLPISFNRRKRRRFSQRIQPDGTPLDSNKRRSSVSDAGLLSVSGSFFDCTTSPDKLESTGKLINKSGASGTSEQQTPAKNRSMRFNHFMDFFSTESNYVGILDTIVNLFKNPLEDIAETNDALLNKSEIKAIFGNFLPIHEVHQRMLERLRALQSNWHEDCLIGEIILQHRDDLIKAYPPYVNFFEQMKEMLQHCDNQNPRFHAFLKINQTKPECGRQSLQDLMIRPVQRLPSISLLLNDILKHTNKNNPDFLKLEEALKAIKEVMAHINEDKRKTESRMAIFDIFNDIEGCPAHLVSSNRCFISKCEVVELSDNLSGRGDSLMLYLFSDSIEVCKKRSRGLTSTKSPSATKAYKHIKLMSLNSVRFVVDITDSPRAFALLYRQEKEKLYSFSISDEEVDKVVYLKALCKQMAENACRTDTDKALLHRTSQELDVDISDVNLSTLSKAFKLARRTRMQVGRAFSFNKTPSRLKRAVSTMMTSPFGSTNSLTPASQLAQMRLASCTNIHEVTDEGSRSSSPSSQASELLVPPLSIQPTRKNKCSTLIVGRL